MGSLVPRLFPAIVINGHQVVVPIKNGGKKSNGDDTWYREWLKGCAKLVIILSLSCFMLNGLVAKKQLHTYDPEFGQLYMYILLHSGCPSNPPQFAGSPNLLAGIVTLLWDEPHIEDPLITSPRYALYSMCGGATTPTLEAEGIQGSSYAIRGLPAFTQCTVQVVLYSTYCQRDVEGSLVDSVNFTTATEGE